MVVKQRAQVPQQLLRGGPAAWVARQARAHRLHQRTELSDVPELAYCALPGVLALAVRGGVDVPLHPLRTGERGAADHELIGDDAHRPHVQRALRNDVLRPTVQRTEDFGGRV